MNSGGSRACGIRSSLIGVAQEKAKAFSGTKVNGQFRFNGDKTVYVNHYYFYIDDEDFGPLFIKVCSLACRGGRFQPNYTEIVWSPLDKSWTTCRQLDMI